MKDRRCGREARLPSLLPDHFPLILGAALFPSSETEGDSPGFPVFGAARLGLGEFDAIRQSEERHQPLDLRRVEPLGGGSSAISSVVFEAQPAPNAPIRAPRTSTEAAINRRRGVGSTSAGRSIGLARLDNPALVRRRRLRQSMSRSIRARPDPHHPAAPAIRECRATVRVRGWGGAGPASRCRRLPARAPSGATSTPGSTCEEPDQG